MKFSVGSMRRIFLISPPGCAILVTKHWRKRDFYNLATVMATFSTCVSTDTPGGKIEKSSHEHR